MMTIQTSALAGQPLPSGAPTMVSVLRGFADAHPDKVFCRLRKGERDTVLTYGALLERGHRYADAYRAAGLRRGDVVVIVLGHGPDLIQAFIGALLGGMIPSYAAPLGDRQEPRHYWEQLRLQLARFSQGAIVTGAAFAETLASRLGVDARIVTCEHVAAHADRASVADGLIPHDPAPDDVAFIQHSSGTTGARKGVALSHRAVLDQARRYGAALGLRDDDVVVSWLPLYHDMGLLTGFLIPLLSGTELILLDPFEWVAAPHLLLTAITRFRGSLVWLPNFAFQFLARARIPAGVDVDLSSVRAFVNCSEPCKTDAFEAFLRRFAALGVRRESLQICYAMAEMVFAVTQTALDHAVDPLSASKAALADGRLEPARDEGDAIFLMPVGRPIDGAELRIVDEERAPLAEGRLGEVGIRAPYMFSGYHLEDDLTRAAFDGGWYLSGDLGVLWRGALYITGRKKDVIIVNGKNYYAHDIEEIVNTVPGVKPGRCVCLGRANAMVGSEAVHVIAETEAPEDRHAAIARAVKDAVQARMGLVVAKVALVPLKWLIKTTSGKISRKDNAIKYMNLEV